MKFSKMTAAAMIAALAITPAFGITAFAENAPVEVNPSFSEFNPLEVNGTIILNLPENVSASVYMTAVTPESPEGGFEYYNAAYSYADSSAYALNIEGNDDRTYSFELSVTDYELNLSSGTFTDEFVIPDGEPYGYSDSDTWVDYSYIISVEQKNSDEPYVFERTEKTVDGKTLIETNITFYIAETYTKGDVNEDGKIDSLDASMVLTEYAAVATQQPSTLTENQKKAADVNEDGKVDALDASKILEYYADAATGKTPSWD